MCVRNLAVCITVCTSVLSAAADDGMEPKKPTDAEIVKMLVGKWEGTDPITGTSGTIHYAKDGTFTGKGTTPLDDKMKVEFEVEGTWKVSGGAILFTITKSTRPGIAPVGAEVKEVVHAIDEKAIRYTRGLGKEKTRTRVKE